MNKKVAVVLFNLGGPDKLASVEPYLTNIFSDPAILPVPILRRFLARTIARKRAPISKAIYELIGGRSPILDETTKQAQALADALETENIRVFVSMRYWHPFCAEAIREIAAWGAKQVVLLPLYPQFSTTTTGSSIDDWKKTAKEEGLTAPTKTICCYFTAEKFVAAHAALLRQTIKKIQKPKNLLVLFSAHGLPKRTVDKGDPYIWQVEETAKAISSLARLSKNEWRVSYQSKVTPVKWVEPSTEDEIIRAGKEGRELVVVPIAFVSEHSETLVELDIEYSRLAQSAGVTIYERVPALGDNPIFIDGLANIVVSVVNNEGLPNIGPALGSGACPVGLVGCRALLGAGGQA